jgi:hypothetical protein
MGFPGGVDTLALDLRSRQEEGVSPSGCLSKYTDEFKRDAVELVRSSGELHERW